MPAIGIANLIFIFLLAGIVMGILLVTYVPQHPAFFAMAESGNANHFFSYFILSQYSSMPACMCPTP
jgi:Na+/proline symporter